MSLRSVTRLLLVVACVAPAVPAFAQEIYVPNYYDGDVSVLDATMTPVARIAVTSDANPQLTVPGQPSAVVFTLDHKLAFVALSNSDRVAVIDTATRTVVQYIQVAPVTFDALIFLEPAGSRLYVTSCTDPYVSVIDVSTRSMAGTIPLTSGSYSLAFNALTQIGYLGNGYAGCGATNGIHRINSMSGSLIDFIPTTQPVSDFAVSPNGQFGLGTGGNSIVVVNLVSNTESGAVMCGAAPCWYGWTAGIAFNAAGTRAYAVDWLTNEFIVIDTDVRGSRFLQELARMRVQLANDNALWQVAVRQDRAFAVATGWDNDVPYLTSRIPGEVVAIDVSTDVPVQLGTAAVGAWTYELDVWPLPTSTAQCQRLGWRNYGFYFVNQGDCMSWVIRTTRAITR
jgi:YVTN family beta-propeller protein